jgi:hypothetical protein
MEKISWTDSPDTRKAMNFGFTLSDDSNKFGHLLGTSIDGAAQFTMVFSIFKSGSEELAFSFSSGYASKYVLTLSVSVERMRQFRVILRSK